MPFKSQAQRRKFAQLLVQGKIGPDVFEEWNRETGGRELPERVSPRPGAQKAPQTKPRTKRKAATAKAAKRVTKGPKKR